MLTQSPEADVHDKVLEKNPDQIGIWFFEERGKTGVPGEKPVRARMRLPTTNSTIPHMTLSLGIERMLHYLYSVN